MWVAIVFFLWFWCDIRGGGRFPVQYRGILGVKGPPPPLWFSVGFVSLSVCVVLCAFIIFSVVWLVRRSTCLLFGLSLMQSRGESSAIFFVTILRWMSWVFVYGENACLEASLDLCQQVLVQKCSWKVPYLSECARTLFLGCCCCWSLVFCIRFFVVGVQVILYVIYLQYSQY